MVVYWRPTTLRADGSWLRLDSKDPDGRKREEAMIQPCQDLGRRLKIQTIERARRTAVASSRPLVPLRCHGSNHRCKLNTVSGCPSHRRGATLFLFSRDLSADCHPFLPLTLALTISLLPVSIVFVFRHIAFGGTPIQTCPSPYESNRIS